MQLKKTLLAIMMFGAAAAHADYQFELSGSLGQSSFKNTMENPNGADYKSDTDTDSLDLGATLYFAPVSTAKGPLAEAAFLSKASEVSIGILRDDVEEKEDGYKDKYDVDHTLISGQFVLPDPSLIFNVGLGTGKHASTDTDVLAFGFGGYITDHITLTLDFVREKFDFDYGDDDSVDSFILTYKQLIELSGESSLVLEPYLKRIDDFGDDAAEVGVDAVWYINRQLGINAGLSGYARDSEYGDVSAGESHIGIDYFFNESVRVGATLKSMKAELDSDYGNDQDGDGHSVEFNVGVRF